MDLYFWNNKDYFKKLPSNKIIKTFGRRRWDKSIEHTINEDAKIVNSKTVFTMPCFGMHGRWGNIVFQYLFMRIIALKNNGEIELSKEEEGLKERMALYTDMDCIPMVKNTADTLLLDGYHLFHYLLSYIPNHIWRALFVTNIKRQHCYILSNVQEFINQPLQITNKACIEVEGIFMINPVFYKQHAVFILKELFLPNEQFESLISQCMQNIGHQKKIIGIHIRRGDYVQLPLQHFFQFPVPLKYIIEWLRNNKPLVQNSVLYVCSDDDSAYKELEIAGFDVITTKNLIPKNLEAFDYEQLDWEILRRCDILLTSNSSFSFTAALLSHKTPECFRFITSEMVFAPFNPWEAEPLQCYFSSHYLWDYLYSRFHLIWRTLNLRAACWRLQKDIRKWLSWKITKMRYLYYIYGTSKMFFFKIFNLFEFFKTLNEPTNYKKHSAYRKM